ncbi:UNVERIFIED_CONTAM: hypothetical protein Sradi_5825600 [Sesamum radiatum]|uniref:Uncharacterized protein n=1 Tax=Sesamum radiatum TaxID=300843 RepID=A0AAW2KQL8_SESRA
MQLGLIHFPMRGMPFTWHNRSEGGRSIRNCLDRALVNETWSAKWLSSLYLCGTPCTSDYPSLVLQVKARVGAGIFKFDNYLAKSLGFRFFNGRGLEAPYPWHAYLLDN